MNPLSKAFRIGILLLMAISLTSCDPNVYASVGYSSWGGYGGGGGLGGSVSVGGRICC
jgi:hypothetical protein